MNTGVEILSPPQASEFPVAWYEMATDTHFWMVWRFRAIRQLLEESGLDTDAPLRVLDIGGGSGIVRHALESATRWTVDSADLNYDGLQQTSAGRGRCLYYDIHERRAELVGSYDLVMALDVIEHIEEPSYFLESAAQHLKTGGLLVVNVPALQSAFSAYDRQVGHLRRYTRASLNREIQAAHLRPLRTGYWGMSLVPVLYVRKLFLWIVKPTDVVEVGFKPSNPWINAAFIALARVETLLFRRPLIGSSVLALARKDQP